MPIGLALFCARANKESPSSPIWDRQGKTECNHVREKEKEPRTVRKYSYTVTLGTENEFNTVLNLNEEEFNKHTAG